MNALPKFVATTSLSTATWSNTTIIGRDVPNAVAQMKQQVGQGSCELWKLDPCIILGNPWLI